MKAVFALAVLTVHLIGPGRCLADWGIVHVSKKQAKEMGIEVRLMAAGPNRSFVEVEFNAEGKLSSVGRVDLRFGSRENPVLTTSLSVDRSKPGRVAFNFTADSGQLDKITLELWAQEDYLGGSVYELQMSDVVDVSAKAQLDSNVRRFGPETRRRIAEYERASREQMQPQSAKAPAPDVRPIPRKE